jgi:hypothetical protein
VAGNGGSNQRRFAPFQSARSEAFTMTDPTVHDGPIWPFTMAEIRMMGGFIQIA